MCELFGVSSLKKIRVNRLLQEFFSHSDKHPNGWGIATFYDGAASIEKEPTQASRSVYLKERLSHKMELSELLAHIRFATIGNMEYDNSHPFMVRDGCGRSWVLIHNGTIFDYPFLSPYQYLQDGVTDSERILLYLVDHINKKQEVEGRPLDASERFAVLEPLIADMAHGNKLNLIIYDGEWMYLHTNYKDSLYVWEQDQTAVFSTVPLREGHWQPLPFTTLCAYHQGVRVLQGQPHANEYIDNDNDLKFLFSAFANL